MWQSEGEPVWQDKTYTARKDKKTLDRNKQGRKKQKTQSYLYQMLSIPVIS